MRARFLRGLILALPSLGLVAAFSLTNVPAAQAATCSSCLVIEHSINSDIYLLRVAKDSQYTCADSPQDDLYQGGKTSDRDPNWADAGCYYLNSGYDAYIYNKSSGQTTVQCSTGWHRLADENVTKRVTLSDTEGLC